MVTSVSNSTSSLFNAPVRTRSFGSWENEFARKLNLLNSGGLSEKEAAAVVAEQAKIQAREDAAREELMGLGLMERTDKPYPVGFPEGVTWADARTMVTTNVVEGNLIVPSQLQRALSEQSTQSLANRYRFSPSREATEEELAALADAQALAKAELLEAGLGEAVMAAMDELGIDPNEDNPNPTGLTEAGTPERFPEDLDWVYLQRRIAVPNITGVEIDEDLLEKSRVATEVLATAGITELYPTWPPGTSVIQAYEDALRQNKNNILSRLFTANELSLKDFPSGITRYEAFRMVADDNTPGAIDLAKLEAVKTDTADLKDIGIYNIRSFKSLGGNTPTKVREIIEAAPEKYRPTQAELEGSKANWKVPPILALDGPVTGEDFKARVVAHALEYNGITENKPNGYTEDEVMARYGFNTVRVLGEGEKL